MRRSPEIVGDSVRRLKWPVQAGILSSVPYGTITAVLPGADPLSIEETVTDLLEEALNTLNNVDEFNFINMENVSQITIGFKLGPAVNVAAEDVRGHAVLAAE